MKRKNLLPTDKYTLRKGKVLGLRTCDANLQAYCQFQWKAGWNTAPDWLPTQECGNGLHFLLWGEGDSSHLDTSDTAKWLIVEADAKSIIDLDGKHKAETVFAWVFEDRKSAIEFLQKHAPQGVKIHYSTNSGEYGSTNSGGDYSTNSGGDCSTNSGGDCSTNSGGDCSYFIGGKNTVFVSRYFDGKNRQVSVAICGKDVEVGKKYKCVQGVFSLVEEKIK